MKPLLCFLSFIGAYLVTTIALSAATLNNVSALEVNKTPPKEIFIEDFIKTSPDNLTPIFESEALIQGVQSTPRLVVGDEVVGLMVQMLRKGDRELPAGSRLYSYIKFNCKKNEAVMLLVTAYTPDGKMIFNTPTTVDQAKDPANLIKFKEGTVIEMARNVYCGKMSTEEPKKRDRSHKEV
jgi:hypothetical protein